MAVERKTDFSPDYAPLPGHHLKEALDDRGIKIVDFATRCGRPTKTISEIISGKTAILPETALQFEKVLGDMPASWWLALQASYQLHEARARSRVDRQGEVEWMRRFPIREMERKGYLPQLKDPIERVEALLSFFGVTSEDAWREYWEDRVATARFKRANSTSVDSYAVSAWLRRGDLDAADIDCELYDEAKFRNALTQARAFTFQPWPNFKDPLVRLFSGAGVALAFVPDLSNTGLRGAAYWASKEKAVVIVSDRMKTDSRFWFALFHEAVHILLHSKKAIFLDYSEKATGEESTEEREADEGAAQMLVSRQHIQEFLHRYGTRRDSYTENSLRTFARQIGIAPSLLLARLQNDGFISWQSALNRTLQGRIEF